MAEKQDGGQRNTVAAASRDYGDYIITESWGGVERSYDGNMAILPVWRAWSRVHNEVMAIIGDQGNPTWRAEKKRKSDEHGPKKTKKSTVIA